MSVIVYVHEAKTYFSRLLARVGSGEEIVIAKAGKPVARLVPLTGAVVRRAPGSAAGVLHMLVAQSQLDNLPILTGDPLIAQYPVEILWWWIDRGTCRWMRLKP